jgi:hypothetical protein
MLKNPLASSVLLFVALISVASSAKADPPDPMPSKPPVTRFAKADPPDPMPPKPPLAIVSWRG